MGKKSNRQQNKWHGHLPRLIFKGFFQKLVLLILQNKNINIFNNKSENRLYFVYFELALKCLFFFATSQKMDSFALRQEDKNMVPFFMVFLPLPDYRTCVRRLYNNYGAFSIMWDTLIKKIA